MEGSCMICTELAIHEINYNRPHDNMKWRGQYCTPCFVDKLRGMAKAWSKK